jgi:hypothetical protein
VPEPRSDQVSDLNHHDGTRWVMSGHVARETLEVDGRTEGEALTSRQQHRR